MTKSLKILILIIFTGLIMGNSNSLISLDKIISNFEWEKRILLLIADHEEINLIRGVDNFFKEEACQKDITSIIRHHWFSFGVLFFGSLKVRKKILW